LFFNCVTLMPMVALAQYFRSAVPGAIGAGRQDRLPTYLRRSLILSSALMAPSLILQVFAQPILEAVGVPEENAIDVGVYCRYMLVAACLMLVDTHLECLFTNLLRVRAVALNSFLTGLLIEVFCAWLFIRRLELGIRGAALTQIVVRAARVAFWACLMLRSGLARTLLSTTSREPLLSRREFHVFCSQALPTYLLCLVSWAAFELQVILITNIRDVGPSGRAAGAVWVNMEGAMAATQQGWIQATAMRTIKLLARGDAGSSASKSFAVLLALSTALVALLNIPLLLLPGPISRAMTNDPAVSRDLASLVWVLAVHTQTRIVNLVGGQILIPMGKGRFQVLMTAICFYCVAAPIACVGALTDAVTRTVSAKLLLSVGYTSIAQALLAVIFSAHLMCCVDWGATARLIAARANTDVKLAAAAGRENEVTSGRAGVVEPLVLASGHFRPPAPQVREPASTASPSDAAHSMSPAETLPPTERITTPAMSSQTDLQGQAGLRPG
jgi:Na+-driven multidrug efflux pump